MASSSSSSPFASSSSSPLPPHPPQPPPPSSPHPQLACAGAERKAGVPPELTAFRAREGRQARERKLRELWSQLPLKDPSSPASSSSSASSLSSSAAASPSLIAPLLPTPTSTALLPALPSDPSSTNLPPVTVTLALPGLSTTLSPERAEALVQLYQQELVRRVTTPATNPHAREFAGEGLAPWVDGAAGAERREKVVDWKEFRTYLWTKEQELWNAFHEFDRNHDGVIDLEDMRTALRTAGIALTPATLHEFVSFLSTGKVLADKQQSREISFVEFRDMLLMLPRSASVPEIYRFYQVRKRHPDGRGAARVNSEGDLSPSFPSTTPAAIKPKVEASAASSSAAAGGGAPASGAVKSHSDAAAGGAGEGVYAVIGGEDEEEEEEDEEEEDSNGISADVALKFLAAGGVAGAVSRTATAPFDRLKVFLITDSTSPKKSDIKPIVGKGIQGIENIKRAVLRLYLNGGGVRSFWVGNGLNVVKIMPESAIKFFSYEASKRFLARYWDHVDDQSQISGSSRFLSGGLGGISSQFAIYPLETLKTQHMTTAGSDHSAKVLLRNAAEMWRHGGIRRYYRGLTLGLVGVFPYAAIDMSTFETLKLSYCQHFELEEPETYAVLAFGAISGGVGATSVYPINVLRTKLQASGSTGHPQTYTGFGDVTRKTISREGWRGLYKGLTVTLAKVVPAVSISYVVYEDSKRKLGL